MNNKTGSIISRRQFTHRAALISATATIAPTEAFLPATSLAAAQSMPQLFPEGQLEADSRYQQVLSLYGERLDDAQKAVIKKMCADLQPTLERIRKFNLGNGNAPALYLKPLVDHEKKSSHADATAKRP